MKPGTLRKSVHKYGILLLLLFLFGNLTACKSQNTLDVNVPDVSQSETEQGTMESTNQDENTKEDAQAEQSAALKESEDTQSGQDDEAVQKNGADFDKEAKNMYTSILKDIYYKHTFPDGQACDWNDNSDISKNRFAVYDIDQDSKEELIIEYANASMAGMVELIYDYDNNTKTADEEFREFPALTYYDNGIIKADWSHNQGLAGNFWPYTLYQYDRESDSYVDVGMVDAWDRSLSETDYNGNSFPAKSDTDGDGIVYYIMEDGEYKLDHPVDWTEYEQWQDSYLGTAKEINVPFMDLTEENIDNIQ